MFIPNQRNIGDDDEKSYELYLLLKASGLAFPDTEEELEQLLAHSRKNSSPIPKELDDPALILKRGLLELTESLNPSTDKEIEENLAQAAREGSQIPEDVKQQMERDREDSEKKSSNGDPD